MDKEDVIHIHNGILCIHNGIYTMEYCSMQLHGALPFMGSFCSWDFLDKNNGVGFHFLLQGFFLTQGSQPASPALAGVFFTTELPGKPTMEYYSAIKKNEIGSLVKRWMDLETVIYSEAYQKEKNKYHTLTYICRI